MKILIIEDNPTSMKLACDLVGRAGYEVLAAENAEQGIELARRELPHLIIMDIQLPGMDGLAATRLLKEEPGTGHIKIIAFTAFAMKGDRERILAAGCDGYVAKPLRYKEFIALIKSFDPGQQSA